MFNTIQNAKHSARTFYGDSKMRYGGIEAPFRFKPQGVGQGNGAGPPVWAVVSSAMFEVLKKRGLDSKIVAPISGEQMKLCGFAFVDDTDLIASSGRANNRDLTVQRMQKSIDCWEGTAKTTGGALEPSKCCWFSTYQTSRQEMDGL